MALKGIIDTFLDLIVPPICLLCLSPSSKSICEDCLVELKRLKIKPPRCIHCGSPMTGRRCIKCRQRSFAFKFARGAYIYHGKAAILVENMKYRGFRSLTSFMAREMANLMEEFKGRVLVPIPLHPARVRERGFSQTLILSNLLSKITNLPTKKVLIRRKHTKPQVKLSSNKRWHNVKGVFQVNGDVVGQDLILVDDVMTTGATVNEATRVLLRAGANSVEVLVFAIAP